MLEQFYQENYSIVYGYLLSLCGDASLAEELTAETFCKAIAHIERYDPTFKPSTWLCTIGRNLLFNEFRRRRRYVHLEDTRWPAVSSPESIYLDREQAEQILTQLDDFAPQQRQLFLMRLQGMSFRKIGEALGNSENWARVTFFRMKCTIKQKLEVES